MNRYKVFLRSGTVVTIEAQTTHINNKWLTLYAESNSRIVATFAPDMWEGYQDVTARAQKTTEKSGS